MKKENVKMISSRYITIPDELYTIVKMIDKSPANAAFLLGDMARGIKADLREISLKDKEFRLEFKVILKELNKEIEKFKPKAAGNPLSG